MKKFELTNSSSSISAERNYIATAIVSTVLLYLTIVFIYTQRVVPVWGYAGYSSRPLLYWQLSMPLLLCVIPIFWLPLKPNSNSESLLWIVHVLVVVPTCAVAPLVPTRPYWSIVAWCSWIILCSALSSWFLFTPRLTFPVPRIPKKIGGPLALAILFLIFIACVEEFGLNFMYLRLSDVYVARLQFREQLLDSPRIYGYLMGWLGGIVTPILIVSGVFRKSLLVTFTGLFALYFCYSTQGSRQTLFFLPLAVVLFWSSKYRASGSKIVILFLGLLIASDIGFEITNKPIFLGAIGERLFSVPGLLGAFYFDQFAKGPPILYRDSFGATLFDSPLGVDTTYFIGERYLGNPASNANINIFGEAFAQFWYAGVLTALALGLVLYILDALTRDLPRPPVIASLALVSIALANTGLSVVLLSTGLAPMLIIFYVGGEWLFDSRRSIHLF
jgi:hypothetical protein